MTPPQWSGVRMRLARGAIALASLLVVLGLVVSCGDGDDPSVSSTTTVPIPTAEANVADLADLALTLESAGARSTKIGPEGGSVIVRTSDGAVLKLTIPAHALATTVAVQATPATVRGSDGSGWAVEFGPSGLEFLDFARLTVTPPATVSVEREVLVAVEGGVVTAALPYPGADRSTIAIEHFSWYGLVHLSPGYQLQQLVFASDRAQVELRSRMAALLQEQNAARAINGGGLPDFVDRIDALQKEWVESVVAPLAAATSYSCENVERAAQAMLGYSRTLQLLGLEEASPSATVLDGVKLFLTKDNQCEKRAMEICRSRRDPAVLIRYWLGLERVRALLGLPAGPTDVPEMIDRAKKLCRGSYAAKGTVPGGAVTGIIQALEKPFALSATFTGGSGTFRFSPVDDRSGRWEFTGKGGGAVQTGVGTYTIAGEDGGPLELTTTGRTCVDVSGICQPADHAIALTPR